MKFKGVFEDRSKRRFSVEIEARSLESLMDDLEDRQWSVLYYHQMKASGEDGGESTIIRPMNKPIKRLPPEREGNLSLLNFDAVNAQILKHSAVSNDKELQGYLWSASSFYNNGFYGFVHQNLWRAVRRCNVLEPHIFYYLRVCERVLLVPLTPDEAKYEHRFMATQMAKGWLEAKIRQLCSIFMKDNVRCKWCGRYTPYIDPDVPTFGFANDNNCRHCGRMYPMPSWVWDSPHGRTYSYFRSSHNSREFDDEFERDYEVENRHNTHKS